MSTGSGHSEPDAGLSAVMSERRQLLNLAYRLLGSLAEAEDAVQETYARWYALSRPQRDAIDTGNARRDTHLRSADLFDSDQYPDITFAVDGARLTGQDPAGQSAVLTGALTVRGVTRPLSFDTQVSVRGDGEIVLDGAVRINRADFGLTWNVLGTASMLTTITVHALFTAAR